jgi:hypothetical protein
MMKRRLFLGLAGVAGGLALAGMARGAPLGSTQFEKELSISNTKLKLLGTGLYYYKLFIKVAAAALYLEPQARRDEVLGDVAKRLEMEYFWGVKASDLVAGSDAVLSRNISADTRARLGPEIEQMFKLYQNVSAGDRVALMYLPGAGTTLLYNGKRLGTVRGADFAAAYFSIWFGDKPLDSGLKTKLLGQ